MRDDPVIIHFPAEPVAFKRTGSHGSQRFTPKKQAEFKRQFGLLAKAAMHGRGMLARPVEINMRFVYVPPKSWPGWKQVEANWKQSAPDLDNLVKSVLDAMSGIVFVDDAQVVSMTAQKYYGPAPLVVVTVAPLNEMAAKGLAIGDKQS